MRASPERIQNARLSLDGLSVGDALGERFFGHPAQIDARIGRRELPGGPWRFTDDTVMAISIVEILERYGEIRQSELARAFAERYRQEPARGYGRNAHEMLSHPLYGQDWRALSQAAFGGTGSMGNGSAMRAGPIGAFFWDDPKRVAKEAKLSSEPTHIHSEGQIGAVAVALAASWATQLRQNEAQQGLFDYLLVAIEDSEVKKGIQQARSLDPSTTPADAAATLGSGQDILAQDTVPFCIWIASNYATNYEEAIWATLAGKGDRDTTCAIVGSIVALSAGAEGIPTQWLEAREPLSVLM